MRMSDVIFKISHDVERIEKMKILIGYIIGGVVCTTSLLYLLDKRGVINV